jgi:hypothetical protein
MADRADNASTPTGKLRIFQTRVSGDFLGNIAPAKGWRSIHCASSQCFYIAGVLNVLLLSSSCIRCCAHVDLQIDPLRRFVACFVGMLYKSLQRQGLWLCLFFTDYGHLTLCARVRGGYIARVWQNFAGKMLTVTVLVWMWVTVLVGVDPVDY